MSYKQPAEIPRTPTSERRMQPADEACVGCHVTPPTRLMTIQELFMENYTNQMSLNRSEMNFWRVEDNNRLVLQTIGNYPTFYEQHCYILLRTWMENTMKAEVHIWVGSQVSQKYEIEVLVKVSDALKMADAPRIFRQCQYYESKEFMELFPRGVRYLRGTNEAYKNFDRGTYIRRLFKVKGKKYTRIIEVPLTPQSLTDSECFILTDEWTIYCWNGKRSSDVERIKSVQVARDRRDEIAAGIANVLVIDDGVDSKERKNFLEALGAVGMFRPTVIDERDEMNFQTTTTKPMLFRMTDKDQNWMVHAQEVTTKPLYKHLLKAETYYILDPNNKDTIYIWVGKDTSNSIKMEAFTNALSYIQATKSPPGITVCRMVENNETREFKKHFSDWPSPKVSFSVDHPINVSESHQTTTLTRGDDASGSFKIWRVEDFNRVVWPKEYYGVFYQTDCYIIMYKMANREEYIIYIWQGRFTTDDEIVYSMHAAQKLDDSINGKATQVRVANGTEPEHFLKLFKGKLIVLLAGKGQNQLDDKMFFQINGDNEYNTRALQVAPQASVLQSDSCFLLKREGKNYLWNGKYTSKAQRDAAELVADRVAPNGDLIICQEGFEREMFWYQLGGKKEYNKAGRNKQKEKRIPKLYRFTDQAGKFMVKEIYPFEQSDLQSDEVMILDTDEELYVWIGDKTSPYDKQQAWKTAKKYVAASGRVLDDTTITQVKQGVEPQNFKFFFNTWRDGAFEALPQAQAQASYVKSQQCWDSMSYSDLKRMVMDENNKNQRPVTSKKSMEVERRRSDGKKTSGGSWTRYYTMRMFMGDPE